MHSSEWIQAYGYLAIVIGTFFEGELIMLAAGLLAAGGFLNLGAVILFGMAGIFACDTICFFLGRFAGHRLGRWFPELFQQLRRVFDLMEQYNDRLVVCFQFFPGLCTVTPMAYGMTRISVLRFMALDMLGNAAWTLLFACSGFYCGRGALRLVHIVNRWIWIAGAAMVVCYVLLRLCRRLRQPKHNNNNPWSAPVLTPATAATARSIG